MLKQNLEKVSGKNFWDDVVVFFVKGVKSFHGSLGENYVFVASFYGNLYETKINYTAVKIVKIKS